MRIDESSLSERKSQGGGTAPRSGQKYQSVRGDGKRDGKGTDGFVEKMHLSDHERAKEKSSSTTEGLPLMRGAEENEVARVLSRQGL